LLVEVLELIKDNSSVGVDGGSVGVDGGSVGVDSSCVDGGSELLIVEM